MHTAPYMTILGAVRLRRGAEELELGGRQRRLIMALLMAGAGRPVPLPSIVDALWPEAPPGNARTIVYRNIGALRRLFDPGLPARAGGAWILGHGQGYRLAVAPEVLDLSAFRDLVAAADRRVRSGAPAAAVPLFARALALWQGPVAYGLDRPDGSVFADLDREYAATVRRAGAVAVGVGAASALLPVLHEAASREPFDETIQAHLMAALAAAGNQAAALARYDEVRARLAEDLGADPGAYLREMHGRVLRQEFGAAPELPSGPARPRHRVTLVARGAGPCPEFAQRWKRQPEDRAGEARHVGGGAAPQPAGCGADAERVRAVSGRG